MNKYISHLIKLKNKSILLQVLLFLTVNGLFIFKYVSRSNINSGLIFLLYLFCIAILIFIGNRYIGKLQTKTINFIYWSIVVIAIGIIHIIHILIDPLSIQVDRWSAINNFIESLFHGDYPYLAKTHLGGYGSPFPIWQFFHIPFYLLGDVGIGMLFVFSFLAFMLIRIFNNPDKALIYLTLLLASPAFWYEVIVRSDLMYNFIICFILILFLHKNNIHLKNYSLGLGIICGLFLSTRLSIVIPFAIFLLADFWGANLKNKLYFILSGLVTFILTFSPFIFWNFNALLFFEYNPFILQSRQGSIYEIIILFVAITFFAFKSRGNLKRCFSYTSYSIILFVGATFLHRMIIDDFSNGLFSSRYDITYFNMALPFIIYVISENLFSIKSSSPLN